ncbi:MAG: selenium cofactor biosynthesis protein YqeC [Acidimicrobiales bacterium]
MTVDPIPLEQLATALELGSRELVAIVGGGGKTTTMFALADQLSGTKVATTTTKMGHDQHWGNPVLLAPTDAELTAAVVHGGVVVAWKSIDGTKAVGVDQATCDHWFNEVEGIDHVLVEADGARRRPFKAPGPLEPVIPSSSTITIIVVGADALGRVIGDQCHRPLRVAALAGCGPYERLTPERAATVLLHERGFLASVPPAARLAIVITKVDDTTTQAVADLVAALETRRSVSRDFSLVTVASH